MPGKMVSITTYLDQEIVQLLDIRAKQQQVSRGYIIRSLLAKSVNFSPYSESDYRKMREEIENARD